MPSANFKLDLESILDLMPVSHSPSPSVKESTRSDGTKLTQMQPHEAARTHHLLYTPPYSGALNLTDTKYKLRDYQIDGIAWLAHKKRAFLTDKPGLGKTLQAACAAVPPVLILAPTYLTYNWYNFLREVVPVKEDGTQSIVHVTGTREQKLKLLYEGLVPNWTICNIEMLRDYDFTRPYTTLIIDEAHHLRGVGSLQSKAARDLANRKESPISNVYLLTATPILNRPDDLFGQLRVLDPKRFSSYWDFINAHCIVLQQNFGPKVMGAKPSLKPLFEEYNLGRTYQDVKLQIPDLISDTVIIEPPPEFKKLYLDLRDRYFVPGREYYSNALEVLQAMRTLTAPQKLKPVLSLLKDTNALSGTVIFSYFKSTARQIAELLEIPCITGDMNPKERLKLAQSAQCLSATIDSMSEGVDLSHLHTVIFFELGYVPGTTYQALSRVRRHGGASVVNVYYMIVKNTIDEILYKIQDGRTSTINSIVRECLEI